MDRSFLSAALVALLPLLLAPLAGCGDPPSGQGTGRKAAPAPAETPEQEFARRWREARAASDPARWLETGEWCETHGFPGRARLAYEEGLRIDPEHEGIRARAGFVRYEGEIEAYRGKRWLTAVEAKAAAEEEAAEKARREREERASSDPRTAAAEDLKKEILERPGLKEFSFTSSLQGPYLILMQESGRGKEMDDSFHRRMGRILLTLYGFFHDQFAGPFGLGRLETRPGDGGILPVVNFLSREEFERYHKRVAAPIARIVRAYYNPGNRTIMSHEDQGGGRQIGRANFNLNVLFHEGVHQLVHAYTRGEGDCQSHWFQEGFAEILGSVEREVDPGSGEERYRLLEFNPFRAQSLKHGDVSWYFKLEDLLKLRGTQDLYVRARRMAGPDPEKQDAVKEVFYAQAWSLAHFFWFAEEGRHREAFRRYVKEELEGRSGFPVFRKVFEEPDLEEMHREWDAYAAELARRWGR